MVSLITLSDLTFRAGQLDQLTGNTLQIMGLTLLFYFVMAQILVAVMRLVDRRFQPGRKRGRRHELLTGNSMGNFPADDAGVDQDNLYHPHRLCHRVSAGLFLAMARRSAYRWLAFPATGVIEFIRSTPLLIQVYFIFYVLPNHGLNISATQAGIIGIGLHLCPLYR